MKGEVIGINTIKFTGLGVEGLSFSIPVDTVQYVIGHFDQYGKVRRPYLGAVFMESIAARYGLPSYEGISITEMEVGSPAENAGLEVDDIILAVNGAKITTIIDYNEEMKRYLPGDTAIFKVKRDDKEMDIAVEFREKE